MKVLLAVGAVMGALLAGALTGGVLTATGQESPEQVGAAEARPDKAKDKTKDSQKSTHGNPAARAFVAAKKEWTACVAEAAPSRDRGDGRFDPDRACGTKPHPHDFAGKYATKKDKLHEKKRDKSHGPPPWAGGPDHRSSEPPGHAKRE